MKYTWNSTLERWQCEGRAMAWASDYALFEKIWHRSTNGEDATVEGVTFSAGFINASYDKTLVPIIAALRIGDIKRSDKP